MNKTSIPEGFVQVEPKGAFIEAFGPLYYKKTETQLIIALKIEAKHLNLRGIAHGGMLASLADSALGIAVSLSRTPPLPVVTVNLSIDFAEPAKPGDWVEAHVDIQRVGTRLAFANCYLKVGERRILRASGVFAVVEPQQPPLSINEYERSDG
jgi:uncharacterized protein (TIGR00369 family)